MTIKDIKKLVDSTLETKGFKRDFPVRLNRKLDLDCTYGQVRLRNMKIISMEFNPKFVKQAPDNVVREIVLHECAHAIVDMRYPDEFHLHDDVFNVVCAELGIVGSPYVSYVIKRRYNIYCPNCGLIASYNRRTKRLSCIEKGQGVCRKCGAVVRLA